MGVHIWLKGLLSLVKINKFNIFTAPPLLPAVGQNETVLIPLPAKQVFFVKKINLLLLLTATIVATKEKTITQTIIDFSEFKIIATKEIHYYIN